MKKFLIPLLSFFIILVISCNKDKNPESEKETIPTIEISGEITSFANQNLEFQKLSPGKLISLDSVILDESGKFKFSHTSKSSEFYRLMNGNEAIFIIGNPGDAIKINASGPNISRDYTVSGSKDTDLAREMNTHLIAAADSLQSLSNYYQLEKEKNGVDENQLLKTVNDKAEGIFKVEKEYLTKMIESNKESLFIYLALYQTLGRSTIFTFSEDKEIFNYVQKHLSEYHPESGYTKNLTSDLNKLKIQEEQSQTSKGGSFKIGDTAPDIILENPNGEVHSLYSLHGKYILLDFWASWCRPCRMENPNIVAAFKKYSSDNFTIFQVSLDKTHENWVNGIKTDNLSSWTHVSDLKYWNSEAAKLYSIQSIPTNYLLDPSGKIIAINLRGPALDAKLKEIFGH
jgi:peroxiredoxin